MASIAHSSGRHFGSEIRFRFPWRPYQKRVISELEDHLDDRRLHIIAPPGSGKTVIGLEVIRRLDRPTLILAPTITIRNQWIDRFHQLFCNPEQPLPSWISNDIHRPAVLTVSTYQALHTLFRQHHSPEATPPGPGNSARSSGQTTPFSGLISAGIETVVVDEAHHLKNEWWKCLTALQQQFTSTTIVALTATPPYDVSYAEWERYKQFCGPVDMEISLPELVLEKNLCPHQDYIYMSEPQGGEQESIQRFREAVTQFREDIAIEADLPETIAIHPWVEDPGAHISDILDFTPYFSSMLIFLRDRGYPVSTGCMDILGITAEQIPALSDEWLETLLTALLFEDREHYRKIDPLLTRLERQLRSIGAIHRKKVNLCTTAKIEKTLATSYGKLDSIADIVHQEHTSLGRRLRLVILTDYIYKADLPKLGRAEEPLRRIGVVPIFERIRRDFHPDLSLGVLCGTLVIIPERSRADLEILAAERNIKLESFRFAPLEYDPHYLLVSASGDGGRAIVSLITGMFHDGAIQVLVGTKSLLGEGWDAPCINSLILASVVGSFVLSNQMRGRAIRTDPAAPDKSANIWHLVCVETGRADPGDDLTRLQRRFRAFVGVAANRPEIENGFDRISMPAAPYSGENLAQFNHTTGLRAANRAGLRQDWETALHTGDGKARIVEEIKAPRQRIPAAITVHRTIRALFFQTLAAATLILSLTLIFSGTAEGFEPALWMLTAGSGIAAGMALPRAVRALRFHLRHGALYATVHLVGQALLASLRSAGLIKTAAGQIRVSTSQNSDGSYSCRIDGATVYERNYFLESMREVLNPVENPRYIIARDGLGIDTRRRDFHAVPSILARDKKRALLFLSHWKRLVGPAELIYTRTLEGRQQLLAARAESLTKQSLPQSRLISVWK